MAISYRIFSFTLLLLLNSYLGFSQGNSQNKQSYSAVYSNISLKNILEDLSRQYQFRFSYAGSILPVDSIISLKCNNQNIEQFMQCVLYDLPIKHRLIGNQIVLYKSDLLSQYPKDSTRFRKDSIEVRSLSPQKKQFKIYKLSLIDLLYGASIIEGDSIVEMREDSLIIQEYTDSLKLKERENRRKRIRLIRKQYRSNKWGYFTINPELSYWRMRGTTNQSIDYSIFNDYENPDPGLSIQISYSQRVFNDIFMQAGVLGNYLSKNGVHTDYYVSFLEPGTVYQERYDYEARFGYINLYYQIGYEYKVGLNKFVLAAGGFSGIMVRKVSPKIYPYFETKYYVDGPPYYNANYERIEREKINYRKIVPGIMAEVLFFRSIMAKTDAMIGVHGRFLTYSIYEREEPIDEKALTLGLSLGLRYNFK